ncbi:hypothetical protein OG196_01265 [Kitasatospora purpeofusca]|uniref:hypothetical protein n=1 Tax=Kitasatospora purpeofusca TaxID=67352 RepID=UPI002E132E6B|nr:hypothetical protein OG715_00730 [Kitasatospora purpeofusca]WSR37825.1 hypothetical protein OG196_01265 [Kitasatospora purpeofusca]
MGVVVVSVVLTAGYRHALTSPDGPGAQIGPGQRQEALQLPPSVAPGRQSLAAPTTDAFDTGLEWGLLAVSATLAAAAVVTCRCLS